MRLRMLGASVAIAAAVMIVLGVSPADPEAVVAAPAHNSLAPGFCDFFPNLPGCR